MKNAFVRLVHTFERTSLAKLAPHLTRKSYFPFSIERQDVILVLKVFNELTISRTIRHYVEIIKYSICNAQHFMGKQPER